VWRLSRRRIASALALALAVTLALSVRLSRPELHTDEITYMSSSLESMLQGSVFPVKGDGSLFFNKPPLALWLMRGSFELLGPGPFAARLPSVLAAAATAALLFLFAAAVWGEGTGIVAALLFAFTPGPLLLHGLRSATPDALEILLVTAAIIFLELWRRRRRPWMLGGLVACTAASAWVKSPFALLVIGAVLLATELPARRAGQGTPRFGVTLALVAGAGLGAWLLWLAMLSSTTSVRVVTRQLLVQQYAERIEGRLGPPEGPEYYLACAASDFGLLWLVPAGAVAAGWLAARKGRSVAGASRSDMARLAAWALAAPLLATASVAKLPWYAYLSHPGIALLLAVSADRLARGVSNRPLVRSAVPAGCLAVCALWLPMARIWPADMQSRGPAGRLWEATRRDLPVAVIARPGFQRPRRHDDAYREALLYLRLLAARPAPPAAGPGACRAILVNHRGDRGDAPAGAEVIELIAPRKRSGLGIFLIDACGGRLRERLAR